MIAVMEASAAHFPALIAGLRQAERDELAALGFGPRQALEISLRHAALAWTGLVDGAPVCMFGVTSKSWPISMMDAIGEPWLLSTDGILPHRMAFLRRNGPYVANMLARYPMLRGMVDARNVVSLRWLAWLGFRIGPVEPWGLAGELFRPFEMTAT